MWFDILALDPLVHVAVAGSESRIPSLGIVELGYFFLLPVVNLIDHQLSDLVSPFSLGLVRLLGLP